MKFSSFDRCDITTILVIVSEILYPSCTSINAYLDTTMNLQPYYSIHNLCSALVAVMAIVSAPLETVYKWVLLLITIIKIVKVQFVHFWSRRLNELFRRYIVGVSWPPTMR